MVLQVTTHTITQTGQTGPTGTVQITVTITHHHIHQPGVHIIHVLNLTTRYNHTIDHTTLESTTNTMTPTTTSGKGTVITGVLTNTVVGAAMVERTVLLVDLTLITERKETIIDTTLRTEDTFTHIGLDKLGGRKIGDNTGVVMVLGVVLLFANRRLVLVIGDLVDHHHRVTIMIREELTINRQDLRELDLYHILVTVGAEYFM